MAGNARQIVASRLAELKWTKAQLARVADVDPGTVGTFLAGKRLPNSATLGRIEEALGLTPGTLAAPGEEASVLPRIPLAEVPDAELVTELTYRVEKLRRELRDAEEPLQRERRRHERRLRYVSRVDDDSDLRDMWIAHKWAALAYEYRNDRADMTPEDRRMFEYLCDYLDFLGFLEEHPDALAFDGKDDDHAPSNVHELKRERLVAGSLPIDQAAVGGVLHDPEWIKAKEAREAEKRVGEESQDDGGFDPA